MKKIQKSHFIFGGFVLLTYLFMSYVIGYIKYQLSGNPDSSGFIFESIIIMLVLGFPPMLFLINLIFTNSKIYSFIGFCILIIYQLIKIVPDILYYNFTKVELGGYFLLIYSSISLFYILNDHKGKKQYLQNKKELIT